MSNAIAPHVSFKTAFRPFTEHTLASNNETAAVNKSCIVWIKFLKTRNENNYNNFFLGIPAVGHVVNLLAGTERASKIM